MRRSASGVVPHSSARPQRPRRGVTARPDAARPPMPGGRYRFGWPRSANYAERLMKSWRAAPTRHDIARSDASRAPAAESAVLSREIRRRRRARAARIRRRRAGILTGSSWSGSSAVAFIPARSSTTRTETSSTMPQRIWSSFKTRSSMLGGIFPRCSPPERRVMATEKGVAHHVSGACLIADEMGLLPRQNCTSSGGHQRGA